MRPRAHCPRTHRPHNARTVSAKSSAPCVTCVPRPMHVRDAGHCVHTARPGAAGFAGTVHARAHRVRAMRRPYLRSRPRPVSLLYRGRCAGRAHHAHGTCPQCRLGIPRPAGGFFAARYFCGRGRAVQQANGPCIFLLPEFDFFTGWAGEFFCRPIFFWGRGRGVQRPNGPCIFYSARHFFPRAGAR